MREEFTNPVPALDHIDEGGLVFGALVRGQATPLRHDFVKREGDDLPFNCRAALGCGAPASCGRGCCCRRDGMRRLGDLGCFRSRGLCHAFRIRAWTGRCKQSGPVPGNDSASTVDGLYFGDTDNP